MRISASRWWVLFLLAAIARWVTQPIEDER